MSRSEAKTRRELIDPKLVAARFHRHSIRLKGYNYSQPGAYFITLVARERGCIFGEIQAEKMILSCSGRIVQIVWESLPRYFPVRLDEWIVMPNHLHGIILIDSMGAPPGSSARVDGMGRGEADENIPGLLQSTPLPSASPLRPVGTVPGSLGAITQTFKSMATRKINALQKTPGGIVWQRNYYEHVIHNEAEWERIRKYIQVNPLRWVEDEENPVKGARHGE